MSDIRELLCPFGENEDDWKRSLADGTAVVQPIVREPIPGMAAHIAELQQAAYEGRIAELEAENALLKRALAMLTRSLEDAEGCWRPSAPRELP